MTKVVRRHWRRIAATSCICLVGLACGFFIFDVAAAFGQQVVADGQNFVTEEEMIEWWYSQVGRLMLKWWAPVVAFLIVWTWRGFAWQSKTAQAIAENAEATSRNSESIRGLALEAKKSSEAARKESVAAREAARADSAAARAEAAAESARIRSLVRKVGEAVIASLDDEAERRRLTRGMLDLDD